jgi:hypothetical protein
MAAMVVKLAEANSIRITPMVQIPFAKWDNKELLFFQTSWTNL